MPSDWRQAVGGTVSEGFTAEKLDVNQEYVLELVESDYVENMTLTFHDETQVVDRFKTVWQVDGHNTKVWVNFNLPLGYLAGVAGPNERSNVVKFAKRLGKPVTKDQPFRLADHFQDHMRIRGYLKKQKDSDFYNLDLDTVGPFNRPEPAPPTPSQEKVAGLKKLIDLYFPVREEARKMYLALPGSNEAEFSMLWDMVNADREKADKEKREKAAASAPVIVGS